MASNPNSACRRRSGRPSSWRWIRAPTPQALLNANIVFDFRPLYGDTTLCDALRDWLFGYTQANPMFLRLHGAERARVEPPLGLIRTFVVDDEPGRQGHARPQGPRDAAVRRLRARLCAGTRHSRNRDGRAAAAGRRALCTSRRSTSTRPSRHSISCSSCGCGSRTNRGARRSESHRPLRTARNRPAHAEGGVPAGEAAAGAAAPDVPAVRRRVAAARVPRVLASIGPSVPRPEGGGSADDHDQS